MSGWAIAAAIGWALLAVLAIAVRVGWLRHRSRDRVRDAALKVALEALGKTPVRHDRGDDLMGLADTLRRQVVSRRGGINA